MHDPSHPEGHAGDTPFQFRVRLSIAPCGGPATVDYAPAHGTADGADYDAAVGTLTFQEGETEKSVVAHVHGDADFEPDETFMLNLIGASGAAIADGQGIATILNDDPQNRQPSCGAVSASAPTLWPPDHRFRAVGLSGATDPDGDPVAIAVTGVTQDEPVDGAGDGATAPDARDGARAGAVERARRALGPWRRSRVPDRVLRHGRQRRIVHRQGDGGRAARPARGLGRHRLRRLARLLRELTARTGPARGGARRRSVSGSGCCHRRSRRRPRSPRPW